MLNDKKIAILIGPQFHDEETTIPKEFFSKRGVRVDIIGLDSSELTGKYGRVTLKPDKTIAEITPGEYDGIIIPGGGAPERIRINRKALDFVIAFWATGRPVGAICHGPQVLISAGLVNGVTLTCYAGIRDDVINAHGRYVDQQVCIDGQLITSRNPDDLPAFNESFAQALDEGFLTPDEGKMDPLQALELAVNREKGAQEFYAEISLKIETLSLKNKFSYLAVVEKGHFEQLSDLYIKLSGGIAPTISIKANELGAHQIPALLNNESAIKLAMDAEQKAYDFYRHAALKSSNLKAREMFEFLAAEELEHKRLLSVDLASTHGGLGHFQWATYFDIPPGMEDLW
jgi:protease I